MKNIRKADVNLKEHLFMIGEIHLVQRAHGEAILDVVEVAKYGSSPDEGLHC